MRMSSASPSLDVAACPFVGGSAAVALNANATSISIEKPRSQGCGIDGETNDIEAVSASSETRVLMAALADEAAVMNYGDVDASAGATGVLNEALRAEALPR